MKKIEACFYLSILIIYSYMVIPYGWDKWMNSENYAAGRFGEFVTMSPILLLVFFLGIWVLDLIVKSRN